MRAAVVHETSSLRLPSGEEGNMIIGRKSERIS
jgi:hypothetical protein